MKTYTCIILGIVVFVTILMVAFACLMYVGAKAWEIHWVKGDSIEGPEGYTYCIMHETGLMQDPGEKLIRTKSIEDDAFYEELGQTIMEHSFLKVIRPSDIPKPGNYKLYLTSNNMLFANAYQRKVPFVYDIGHHQFYDEYGNREVSPFILLDGKSVLYKPDVFWVISLVAEDYHRHIESIEYLKREFPNRDITLEHTPDWPKPELLKEGLEHPNDEVKKLCKWLIEIQQNGFSKESESIPELIDYLLDNETSNNHDTREYISKIFEYTGWKE